MVGRSRASITIIATGVYVLLGGLALLAAPDQVLALAGLPASHQIWPRLTGAVLVEVAILHLSAGRADSRSFAIGSIYGRLWIAILLIGLVSLGQLGWGGLVVALIDTGSAALTWQSLRSEHRHTY